MTDERKIFLVLAFILACLVLVVVLDEPRVPSARNNYRIEEWGAMVAYIEGNGFMVIINADVTELINYQGAELAIVAGTKLDFADKRVEVLESIFGCIQGITAFHEEDEYYISGFEDLENYVSLMKKIGAWSDSAPHGVALTEGYRKDGAELLISHSDNKITYFLPQDLVEGEEIDLLRDFAAVLQVEAFLDFDNPIETEASTIVPIRIDGMPVVAATQEFFLGNNDKLEILVYQGYHTHHNGLSAQTIADGLLLQSIGTVVPEKTLERLPIISVGEAVDAIIANRQELFVDGRYPVRHPFNYREIRLAYGAIQVGDGRYQFEPIYIFVHEKDLEWEFCLIVNAHTGELYDAVSVEYIVKSRSSN